MLLLLHSATITSPPPVGFFAFACNQNKSLSDMGLRYGGGNIAPLLAVISTRTGSIPKVKR